MARGSQDPPQEHGYVFVVNYLTRMSIQVFLLDIKFINCTVQLLGKSWNLKVHGYHTGLVPTLQHLHGLKHGWWEAVSKVGANMPHTRELAFGCCRGTRDGEEVSSHPCKCGVDNAMVLPPLNHHGIRKTGEWLEWRCKICMELTAWIRILGLLGNTTGDDWLHPGSTIEHVGRVFYGLWSGRSFREWGRQISTKIMKKLEGMSVT